MHLTFFNFEFISTNFVNDWLNMSFYGNLFLYDSECVLADNFFCVFSTYSLVSSTTSSSSSELFCWHYMGVGRTCAYIHTFFVHVFFCFCFWFNHVHTHTDQIWMDAYTFFVCFFFHVQNTYIFGDVRAGGRTIRQAGERADERTNDRWTEQWADVRGGYVCINIYSCM